MKHILGIFCFALALTGPSLAAGDTEVEQQLNQARGLLYDSKFQAALDKFSAVLTNHPQNLEARLGKMDALGGLRKLDEVEAFSKTKSESGPDGMVVTAHAKIWNRDMSGAKADLEKAIAADNGAYMAHYLLGYLKRRDRDYDGAIASLKKSLEANANYPETHYLLGEIYRAKGDTNKVIEHWNEYLGRIPRSGDRYDYVNSYLRRITGK